MLQWIAYIIIDVLVNWYWIEKEKKVPNYIILTIVRIWFFIAAGITVPIEPSTFLRWLLYCFCSFWVLFDLGINLMRGKRWNYLGTNSFIDSLGIMYPQPFWAIKGLCLVIFIYYCIYGF